MSNAPRPSEIRAAKSFLERRNIPTNKVSPKLFAQVSKERDQGFRKTFEELKEDVLSDNS